MRARLFAGALLRALLVAVALLGGLGRAEAKVHVVTAIETFADLARRVGGDRVDVKPLSHGYMDPHFIEPKPNLVIDLNRADLLVYVGLELEIGWLPPLVLGSRNDKIQLGMPGNLDASQKIPVLDVPTTKVDRSMGDIHPQGNPHYWIPPDNAVVIAREIAERLEAIDGAGAATYRANLKRFEDEVAKRRGDWEKRAAGVRGTKIVTYHKSWSYVSKWLGLQEIGYVEPKPGIPAPPSHIASLIGLMRREGVKEILMESFYPRNTVELVAEKAGARAIVLPSDVGATPETRDYFSLVDAVVAKLAGGQ
jgi:zinc/manganese transport system substrate-binding protein